MEAMLKVDKCFLCDRYFQEDILRPVLVRESTGAHVEKGACPVCYASILRPAMVANKAMEAIKAKMKGVP